MYGLCWFCWNNGRMHHITLILRGVQHIWQTKGYFHGARGIMVGPNSSTWRPLALWIRAGWNRSTLYYDGGHTSSLGSDQKIHAEKNVWPKNWKTNEFLPYSKHIQPASLSSVYLKCRGAKVTICGHSPFYCYGCVSYCTNATLKRSSDRSALSQCDPPQAQRWSEAAVCSLVLSRGERLAGKRMSRWCRTFPSRSNSSVLVFLFYFLLWVGPF